MNVTAYVVEKGRSSFITHELQKGQLNFTVNIWTNVFKFIRFWSKLIWSKKFSTASNKKSNEDLIRRFLFASWHLFLTFTSIEVRSRSQKWIFDVIFDIQLISDFLSGVWTKSDFSSLSTIFIQLQQNQRLIFGYNYNKWVFI